MPVRTLSRSNSALLKELVESGKIRPAIDRTVPLADAREAVRYAMGGQGRAKVVIPSPNGAYR